MGRSVPTNEVTCYSQLCDKSFASTKDMLGVDMVRERLTSMINMAPILKPNLESSLLSAQGSVSMEASTSAMLFVVCFSSRNVPYLTKGLRAKG